MLPLDRFILALLRITPQGSFVARYRFGVGLVVRQIQRLRARIPCRNLPTEGFRADLYRHGQEGQMYRHLYIHLASYLLGPAGYLFSWAIGMIDIRQAKQGRAESQTEVLDNVAGRQCGRILKSFSRGKISRAAAEQALRKVLAA